MTFPRIRLTKVPYTLVPQASVDQTMATPNVVPDATFLSQNTLPKVWTVGMSHEKQSMSPTFTLRK